MDIYSFGNERPYRIELFGNEVDSIRIFNPETQLSERKLVRVSILPNIESPQVETRISIMDYLPANTVFWMSDKDFCIARLHQLQAELRQSERVASAPSRVELVHMTHFLPHHSD